MRVLVTTVAALCLALGAPPTRAEPPAPDAKLTPNATLDLVDGGLVLEGEVLGRLSDVPAEEQERTKAALVARLVRLTAPPVPRETGTGASRLGLVVRGDRTTKWSNVQEIMHICADPPVKIHRLRFEVSAQRPVEQVISLSMEGRTATDAGVLRAIGFWVEPVSVRPGAAHRGDDLDALVRKVSALHGVTTRSSIRVEYADAGESRVGPREAADVGARLITAGFEDVQIASKSAVGRAREGR